MNPKNALLSSCLIASFLSLATPAFGEVYPVILRGKVMMKDGSPPPKSVGIQRICSDGAGSAPGPITNGKGEYTWRMEVDPMRTRVCRLEATLPGYGSSGIDISNLNGYTNTTQELPPIVLSARSADPTTIISGESDVPGKSKSAWKAAMKGVDTGELVQAERELQNVVKESPKFARGWHTLGIIYDTSAKFPEARDAYEHAIEADPKLLPPYVTLARLAIKTKDWAAAAKAADAGIKADSKKTYGELHLHLAVARFRAKDLAGAEASAREALAQKVTRAEYLLGRIADAKGDHDAARQHITKYLELEPDARDVDQIKAFLQVLGKPEAQGVDPDL